MSRGFDLIRQAGGDIVNVLHIPTDDPVSGMAHKGEDGRYCVTIFGTDETFVVMFVYLHEMAHIFHGDLEACKSIPGWAAEYEADKWAFDKLINIIQQFGTAEWRQHVYDRLMQMRKEHLRREMQPYVDRNMRYSYDLTLARWAGCDIPSLRSREMPCDINYLHQPPRCECMVPDDELPF